MKIKFQPAVSLALLSLVIPLTMPAEGGQPGKAGVVEFTCATWDTLPYPEIFYLHGSKYLPLVLSAGLRSEICTLKDAEILELFIRKDKDAADGTSKASTEYERIGMAPLLKGVKRTLFLIEAKRDANGLPLQILGMDDALEAFPAGSFRLMNQTPDPLQIELAGATCELPAGALKVVSPEIPDAGGFLPVIIKDAQGRNLLESRFLAQRTGRELVVIQPPPEGRVELVMKFLADTIPVSPASTRNPAPRNNMQSPNPMSRLSFRRLVFAGVLLLALCPALSRAQSATGNPGVEFSCLVWEPLPIPEVFYRDGDSYLPLEFSLGNRSRIYPLKQATGFELYSKVVGADGTATYRLVGKAPLAGGTRLMLFVIYPAPNAGGLPLRVFGVDDSLEAFPPGTFKFINLSSNALQVRFGGRITKLPAGEISVVESHVPEKGGFMPFLVGDTDGKIVFETRLFGQPAGREMVFIGTPAEPGGLPRVKFLSQVVPPEPPKPGG